MKQIQYSDIGKMINKSTQTIKGYKVNNPELLELLKIGALCKVNGLDSKDIEELLKIKESVCSICKED